MYNKSTDIVIQILLFVLPLYIIFGVPGQFENNFVVAGFFGLMFLLSVWYVIWKKRLLQNPEVLLLNPSNKKIQVFVYIVFIVVVIVLWLYTHELQFIYLLAALLFGFVIEVFFKKAEYDLILTPTHVYFNRWGGRQKIPYSDIKKCAISEKTILLDIAKERDVLTYKLHTDSEKVLNYLQDKLTPEQLITEQT